MQRLVSLIRAQHQAWSERLAARANHLQSTLTHDDVGGVSPASPPAIATSSVSNQHPPHPSHDKDVGGAVHHHPPTSLHHQVKGVAADPCAYPQPLLHGQDRDGTSLGGHLTAAQQDSLSIFTLSTRYEKYVTISLVFWHGPWKLLYTCIGVYFGGGGDKGAFIPWN